MARKRRSESGAGRKIPPAIWIPFFIALLAYLPTLGHGFVWDDVDFILENPAAHKLSSLSEALQHGYGWVPTETGEQTNPRYLYFRPVIVIANTVQWVLSGGAPWFFHLVNLLTHALTVALLAALALALGLSPITAALVGCVMAVHPIQTEAVAWVSGRTDLCAALFSVVTLLLLALWRRGKRSDWVPYLAGGTFLLALASKESAVALILLGPLLALAPGGGARRGRLLGILAGSFGLYLVLRFSVMGLGLVGGEGPLTGSALAARGGLELRALQGGALFLLYLWRMIVPWPLSVEPPASLLAPPYPIFPGMIGILFMGAALVLGVRLLRRVWQRGESPAALLGVGLFLCALFPVLQWILPTGEIYGERFLYLPMAGLLLFLGTLLDRRLAISPRGSVMIAGGLVLVALFPLEARLKDWHDELALFTSAVRVHPESPRAQANLGSALMDLGLLAQARFHLEEAALLEPGNPRTQAQLGSLLINLGSVEQGVAKLEWARERIPQTKTMLKNLGIGWTHLGRYDHAAEVLAQALSFDPDDPSLMDALGMAELKRGNLSAADELFQEALRRDPGRKSCYLNLFGLHYFQRQDWEAARHWGAAFLRRFPDDPRAEQTRELLGRDPRSR